MAESTIQISKKLSDPSKPHENLQASQVALQTSEMLTQVVQSYYMALRATHHSLDIKFSQKQVAA